MWYLSSRMVRFVGCLCSGLLNCCCWLFLSVVEIIGSGLVGCLGVLVVLFVCVVCVYGFLFIVVWGCWWF